jgi:hypothetical protein
MAAGDFKWFAQGLLDLANKIHDLDSDDWRMGIVTTGNVPTVNETAPHWGGTGTTNFATNQVTISSGSPIVGYTGPIVLTSETLALTATGFTWDIADISILQDATNGFTNAGYGIIYNNTDTNKRAVAYVELSSGGTLSNVSGAVTITINASGALAAAQS